MASRSWNHVELLGHLTHNPELRQTPTGTSVCGFSLATNRSRPGPDGQRTEETAFHRIIAWGPLAEQCAKLLHKGSQVFVAGRLSYRTYTKDDEQRDVTEIVINDMLLLDKRNSEKPAAASATPTTAEHIYDGDEIADAIPF